MAKRFSPTATVRVVSALLFALAALALLRVSFHREPAIPKGRGDGSGSATIDPATPVTAGGVGRWTIRYIAGEEGIAPGGGVVIQFPIFWKWTAPQTFDPGRPGYVGTRCSNPKVELRSFASDLAWVRITTAGRAIDPGDTITVTWGEGDEHDRNGVRIDPYAERGQEFIVKVDGDGDEEYAEIAESPRIDILPGEAEQLRIYIKGSAAPGETTFVTVAALDRFGNRATAYRGTIRFSHRWNVTGLPADWKFTPEEKGARRFPLVFPETGSVSIRVVEEGGTLDAWSNPIEVVPADRLDGYELLWSDLHQHSRFSDGTGEPADLFAYARDVENLDVFALTDHDHHGLRPLDEERWATLRMTADSFYAPSRFVTFPAYEWTNWVYGHRNVYFLDSSEPIRSMADSAFNSPEELWADLPSGRAMTVAHHTGGGPVPTDWSVPIDTSMEWIVEIASVHGSSECRNCPNEIYSPVEGGAVRDALLRGYRLGFLAAGDGHIGHPGETYSVCGGLGGIYARERSRDSVWEALRARRTYGTSGERIVLQFKLFDHWMGEAVPARTLPDTLLFTVEAEGTAPIDMAELIGAEGAVDTLFGSDRGLAGHFARIRPDRETWYYVRLQQMDGGLAWSSPIWIVP